MRKRIIIYVWMLLSLLNTVPGKIFSQTIPYAYVRQADIMWSKEIWRIIDLREKINQPLYYPLDEMPNRKSLFRIIQEGIYSGKISKVYDFDVFTNEFGAELKLSEAKNRMTETIEAKDSIGGSLLDSFGNRVTIQDTIKPDRIAQYWLKEVWFFDKQRSVMEVRITAIAPVIVIDDPDNDRFAYKPLFWISYPDCRDYFSEFKCYNAFNDSDRRNFDEIFQKRFFNSYIIEESNVYGRAITSYAHGKDALLESEKIKEDIFKFEEDLWHH